MRAQALWLGFIFSGYLVARAGCYMGLPLDGVTDADAYDTFDDISKAVLPFCRTHHSDHAVHTILTRPRAINSS